MLGPCDMVSALKMKSSPEESTKRRIPWRTPLAVAVFVSILWVVHPPLLSRGLRLALIRAASEAGWFLEIGSVQAKLGQPVTLENVRVRAANPEVSRTAADAKRVEISLNWPWNAFFGVERFFRSLIIENVRGIIDLRAGAASKKPPPDVSQVEERWLAKELLRCLPQYFEVWRCNLEFAAPNQSYYFEGISADFSEERIGAFRSAGAELRAGSLSRALGALQGVTAWKEGTAYLAGLDLWEGVRIESLSAQLARPGGAALALETSLFGGSLRADVSFGSEKGHLAVDSAFSGSQLEVAPLAALFGFSGKAEGVIREGRLTFRGVAAHALDGEASLRLAADGFRWNKRGWESLEAGASMIHRRLTVSDLELKQKENILKGSGELSLDHGLAGIAKAPFLLNITASVKDLGALAGLFGPPFDEMSGRMSLSSSINGQEGKLSGFMSLEASKMGFRKHPVDFGHVEMSFSNADAQITRCEFWSGDDFLRATGSVGISAPHAYSGEIRARVQDVARYREFLPSLNIPGNRAGAIQIRWQGDGTASAHSGAFNVSLDNLVSRYTPTGLSGRFAGTYSPDNVYLSGFELEQAPLRFSARATLARSGIKLNDAVLRSAGREIAEAEIYLPVDPFDMASGISLKDAFHLDRSLYADVLFKEPVAIREMWRLAGNDLPVEGTIMGNVKAEGLPAALDGTAKIEGNGLAKKSEKGSSTPSQFSATIQLHNGLASVDGELSSPNLPPAILQAEGPVGLVRTVDGNLRWLDPAGRLSASLEIPKFDLGVLRPLLPNIRLLEGFLSGHLAAAGTVRMPSLEGNLKVAKGQLEISPWVPVLSDIDGSLDFSGGGATVESLTGKLGDGSVELRGGASLEDLSNPYYELFFYGRNADLVRMAGLQLRANVDLYASGNDSGGFLRGSVRLVDSRFSRSLEMTPLLSAPSEERPFSPALFQGAVADPFGAWKLDVSISNQTPFLLSGNAPVGEIIPELKIVGTLGSPIPLGQIELKNARVFLPFTTMTVASGHIDFTQESLWMPQLNVRGVAQALDYEVQAYAFGPLEKRQLILRSDPPLSQDALIQLLATGMAPGVYAGAESGLVSGWPSWRPLGAKLDSPTTGKDSLTNGLQVPPPSPAYPGGRATLRGRFELWRGLSLMNEIEGAGPSNTRASFSLRLR